MVDRQPALAALQATQRRPGHPRRSGDVLDRAPGVLAQRAQATTRQLFWSCHLGMTSCQIATGRSTVIRMDTNFDADVVIIGGGAAGLSAALVLGRARLGTVVFDDGQPSNAPAHAIGGLLGQAGTSPLELLASGCAQLAELPSVQFRQQTARAVSAGSDDVEVEGVRARALILATGMHYRRPDLPGLEGLWGDTVFHCPFCHGWEVSGRPLAVHAEGAHAPMMARLLRLWSDDVVLLTDPEALAAEHRAALDESGVIVDGRQVASLRPRAGRLEAIEFADGSELPRAGLLLQTVPEPRTALLDELGLERTDHGTVVADSWGATNLPRVRAVGDLVESAPSVAGAIAGGHRAAAGLVHMLVFGG